MTTKFDLYEVKSHERHNTPDARQKVMTGTAEEVLKYYQELGHTLRVDRGWLVCDAGADSDTCVGVMSWMDGLPSSVLESF